MEFANWFLEMLTHSRRHRPYGVYRRWGGRRWRSFASALVEPVPLGDLWPTLLFFAVLAVWWAWM